jgi:uroporphyrinogen decarboxylase
MGNIDPALLCSPDPSGQAASDPDDLQRAVSRVTALAGRGGVIFGTCSGLHAGMWPERVHQMYQLAAQHDPVARAC